MNRISSAVLEHLEAASTEELEIARDNLLDEVRNIDSQLAGDGRMDGGDFRYSYQEYMDWRRRAVAAKNNMIREQLAIKAELSRRSRAITNARLTEGSTFWKRRCEALFDALEEIAAMKNLPAPITAIVNEALSEHKDRVVKRQTDWREKGADI